MSALCFTKLSNRCCVLVPLNASGGLDGMHYRACPDRSGEHAQQIEVTHLAGLARAQGKVSAAIIPSVDGIDALRKTVVCHSSDL
jgi:hypothetical protein